ncbi:hypothetical protein [Sphingomonas xinjiangensis]|uniref:Uncharacterized protein n=1 Tax=Sphingomonas xinjiangensis TaxID=643568 RepID=A0A840YS52_9SPHN|nr:hypothetical protein [Sphingomonas xinjiangensis]MBB5712508.1 hypothetical protein [Sphingomonas xinjiangensis]
MPRRIAAGSFGIAILAFLTWNVSDGVIYLHGNGLSRADHPVGFWLEAIAIAVAGCAAIYWAVIEARHHE